jgi:hypothetical protein
LKSAVILYVPSPPIVGRVLVSRREGYVNVHSREREY